MASTLDGITVLDLSRGAAGALATMILSDHGARVIRVVDAEERTPRRGGFLVWDRGKECVRLDLSGIEPDRTDTAGGHFAKLVRGADVLVEDFAPAAPEQRIVDYAWTSGLNPGLVSCSITAYGKRGPLAGEPPIDDLVLARMGVLGGMPGFRPAPVHVVHPLPSVGAALFADLGIAAALLARESSGLGRSVETSLMAGALLFHPKVIGERLDAHVFQTHPAGSAPFYSVYQCADGEWVQLGCVHAGFIGAAGELLGIAQTLAEPRFGGGRQPESPQAEEELRALLAEIIRTRPYAEWAAAFEAADIPFARASLTEEGMDDPQVRHNGMAVELEDPELGPILQMGTPIHFTRTPGRARGPRQLPTDAEDFGQMPGIADRSPAAAPTPMSPALQPPPLEGVRVLEITNLIAGPTGGRLLADLGADVIKLEPLEGDMSRPIGRTYFYNVNFNKRSVSVNPRAPEGREIVRRIAASADALLANLRPHATERMGVDADVNPRLIETHLTGYGWTGPYAHRPGIDPLAQALIGLSRAQGGSGNPPVFAAQLAPTDYTNGALGALGTVLALFARTRTGVVQRVESNLLDSGVLLSSEWFTRYAGKPTRPLADREQYGPDAFHRLYQASDGWLYVAADAPEQRAALCAALGQAALATAPTPEGCHPSVSPTAAALAKVISGLSVEAALTKLRAAEVPCMPALAGESELFLDDPHAAANEMIAEREHPSAGRLRVAWQYVRFGNTRPSAGRPTPLLGAHTREVLQEIGFDAAAIASLYERGVVKTEAPTDAPRSGS